MASTVEQFKKTFFDRSAVDKALDRALRRTLSRFGAFVRQRSKSSIRTRKATSQPGSPPTNRTGLLKKMIFFGYEPTAQTVVIGPAAFKANPTAPAALEHGGVSVVRTRKGQRTARYAPRPYMKPAYDAELPKFLDSLKDSM
jgi:hypothetical protein